MKAKALIATAVAAAATGAFAQTHDSSRDTARHNDDTRAEQKADHESAGQKLRNGLHRLGEKTRHAFHRADNKAHNVARRDRDANDTRAMGASRSDDHDSSRQRRMDDAYSNWQSKHDRQDKSR